MTTMTMKTHRFAAALVLTICMAVGSGLMAAQSGYDLFQKALTAENAGGNLPEAIKLYEQIARDFPNDRPLVARTLLRLGECYQTLGNTQSQAVFERLIRQFSDQKQPAAEAQTHLNALATARARRGGPSVRLAARGDDADTSAYLTPDGRFLSRPDWDTGDLAVRDMSTGHVIRLLVKNESDTSDAEVESAIVSSDGKQVVYVWYPDDDNDDRQQLRVMANAVGARSRALIDNSEYTDFEPVAWAPSGDSVLVTLEKPDHSWQIAWVTLPDGKVTPLRTLDWRLRGDRPSLSADGKYVAYSALVKDPGPAVRRYQNVPATGSSDQHIYVLATDGSRPETELVRGANINESPVWTPDGRHILFVSNRSTAFGLWSVAVDNGKAASEPVPVNASMTGRISPIGITRSGTYFYVPEHGSSAGGGGVDVFVADVDPATGKIPNRGIRLSNNVVDWNRSPAWSPDGKRIAFKRVLPEERSVAAVPGSRFVLVVHNVETGTERVYANTNIDVRSPPIWFHTSNSLLTRRNNNSGQLLRLDLNTGEFQSIEAMSHARLPGDWRVAVLSPDDKTLYLTTYSLSNSPTGHTGRIVAYDLVTGEEKEVWSSNGRLVDEPAIALSPDGLTLAMTLRRNGWASPRIALVGIDGSGYRELASTAVGNTLAWAKDGRTLLVVVGNAPDSPLVRMSVVTGARQATGLTIRQPGPGHAITFSPDGSRIVYSDGTRNGELWAVENIASSLGSIR